ncbi:hypothetical protein OK074_1329 [Actinobacteria bacterium OK074]|nr:hypothetical protein OK074_1329 [Actinobacteria bacterium OK074]
MLEPQVTAGGAVVGEQEQVVAFVRGQPQAAGDGRDHLLGRLRPVAALQPGAQEGTEGRAVELGVTMFGTADMYGPSSGEELLGRARAVNSRAPGPGTPYLAAVSRTSASSIDVMRAIVPWVTDI